MFGARKAYRELGKLVRGMQQKLDQLKEENAELRELTMWSIRCSRGLSCHECPFSDIREATVCGMLRYAEKLRVEVD